MNLSLKRKQQNKTKQANEHTDNTKKKSTTLFGSMEDPFSPIFTLNV